MIKWYQAWRRKRAIRNIREILAGWGYDFSHLTDEELEAMVMDMSHRLSNCGITAKAATLALARFSRAGAATDKFFAQTTTSCDIL